MALTAVPDRLRGLGFLKLWFDMRMLNKRGCLFALLQTGLQLFNVHIEQ
jgi:hypothetical protein